MASIKTIDSTELNELFAAGPVVVDFYADWCRPCHVLAPEIEKLASALDDVTVVKLDVDADPGLAQQHGVMGIPTVVHFARGGQEVARSVGVRRAPDLADALGFGDLKLAS